MKPKSDFVWPVRVYWEDTDAGGVVYYANYLKFMERARTEWLRHLGIEQAPLKEQGILMVVASVAVNYRRPARYGDLLQVTHKIVAHGRASVCFEQHIYRSTVGAELLLEGTVRVACIDATTFKPRPLPPVILQEIEA